MLWMLSQATTSSVGTDDVLANYTDVFYASFVVSFMFTPIMRMIAIHFNIIDQPDRIRKLHSQPVAYLGGVAVFLGWLTGVTISQYLILHRVDPGWPTLHPKVHFSIVLGALIIVTLGLWDDVLKVRPKIKIFGQVCAAICLLGDGVGARSGAVLVQPVISRASVWITGSPATNVPSWLLTLCSGVLVVGVIVGCCNASNLMDGLDGLCGGVTAVIAAGFLFLAVHLAATGNLIDTNWDALRIILSLALLGAVLGFVPYNFSPASIFMGDTGSMFLGFVCGTMIILMAQERAKWFLASMVIFAMPILDTALAFTRRWINHRPLFSPDRQHFHHQLVARGYTVKQTVLISYGLAIFFGLMGVAMVFLRTRYTVAIYLVIFGSIIVAAYKMGMVHENTSPHAAATLGDVPEGAFSQAVNPELVMNVSVSTAGSARPVGRV
jgi:UDP-GlcNAc:undecaprenyl-phosphate/decaprenyl-phosphate GlcNAc-1-phosphate transferase